MGAVYWIGANGNTYVKGNGLPGVQDFGKAGGDFASSAYGATQISDPSRPTANEGAYTDTGSTGSSYDPAAAAQAANDAYARQQYQAQLGRLDSEQNIGFQNLNDSYTNNINGLNYSKDIAQRDYGLGKEDTERGYQTARNNVATKTRSQANALQRLIGLAGSGNSSAVQDAVPYAAAREGSLDLQPVQNTYASNRRKQDINWNDTLTDYDTKVRGAQSDKANKENSLRASIAQTRAGILDKLGSIGGQSREAYQGQINGLLDQITNLGRQSINTVAPTVYKAPDLGAYTMNRDSHVQVAPEQQGAAASVDQTLLPLLAQKRDEFGNLIES